MKKTYTFLSVPVIALALMLMSYGTGSPGGKSGSPGDAGATCTQCHSGTANTATGWITTNIPVSGYVAGNTYTITLTGTHTGVVKFGFEVTAEDAAGIKTGTFALADPTQTKFTNNNKAVTHTSSGTAPSGSSKTWTVNWTAPAAGTGQVGFYAAFNAANGNGGTSGDVIYKTSTFVSEDVANPMITGITPDNADQGETFNAVITGSETSWTGSPAVSLVFSGNPSEVINATGVSAPNGTTINCTFSIPSGASPGLWDVKVDELVIENEFEVIELIIALTGIDPASAGQGESVVVSITGSNTSFVGTDPAVSMSFTGNPLEMIEAADVSVQSNTALTATFNIPFTASVGSWDVHVDELLLEGGFEVTSTVGIDEAVSITRNVYPNPTFGPVTISLTEDAEISVWNLGGSMILKESASAGNNSIDLSGYPSGTYILNIRNDRSSESRTIIRK